MNAPLLSHLDSTGAVRMVNVSEKPATRRKATAEGKLECAPETIVALREASLPKGDVLTVAKIAAIQAAKRTSDWIPLCHPLSLSHVEVEFNLGESFIAVRCTTETSAATGVEMEALTGVSAACLTLYDMCKAVDTGMRIDAIRVVEKLKE